MKKLGQLIFTGISGLSLTDDEKSFIQNENIGGVILFSKNYDCPAQLAELVNSIQALRDEYPLFIAVDQEGGRVARFKKGFTQIPSMMDLAKLDSPKLCFEVHKIIAKELKACGVNLNLAPVCDVLVNQKSKVIGDRAFGKDAETVSKFVTSAIRGLQANGVLGCAKHFPGHGNTSKDSHFELPIVKRSIEELKEEEVIPFMRATKARVEFVMMAHLIVEGIDPDTPCSLSKAAYDLAREELRFKGLLITDDMQMNAITDHFGVEDAAVKAILAGADIIEYRDIEFAKRALDGLKKAVESKELTSEIVTDRFNRVMELKKKEMSEYSPIYIPEVARNVGTKASESLLSDILERIQ